ncbi:MAG: hypothetical protein Q7U57_14485 [Methylovulum sp.]|nr:hypothetical protein [Methylovulum sp.]
MKGRILIDVPAHKFKCGQYLDLPDELGSQLAAQGVFDVKAQSAIAEEQQKQQPQPEAENMLDEDAQGLLADQAQEQPVATPSPKNAKQAK